MKKSVNKTYFITVIASLFLFTIVMGFIVFIFYSTLSKNIITIGEKTTDAIVSSANEFLKENIDIVTIESESVDYMMKNGATNKEILDYLTQSSNGYSATISGDFTGFYGVFRDEYLDGAGWVPEEDYVPKDRPWYIAAVEGKGNTSIASPYLDSQTNKIMISIERLLADGDSAISVDISLDYLDEIVNSIKEDGYGDCIIFDDEGMVVSSSLGDKGENYLSGEVDADKKVLAQKIFEADEATFSMSFLGDKTVVFSDSIYGNWKSVLIVDKSSLYREAFVKILIVLLVSSLLLIILMLFCRESNKRRVEAEKSLKQVRAASSIYVSMAELDLANNTYELIYGAPHIAMLVMNGSKRADEILRYVMGELITEEYKEDVLNFVDLSTLQERIKDSNTITYEFYGRVAGWCRGRFIAVEREEGQIKKVLFAVEDINVSKLEEERLVSESTIDKLSGCLNRKAYEDMILRYTLNPMEKELVYISLDVNGLKAINDDYGHAAGDELIKGAADCIKKATRTYGKVYRIGGDEFAAIVLADNNQLATILNNLKSGMSKWHGKNVDKMAISMGYAKTKDNISLSIKELAKIADKNMYEDKSRYYMENGIDRRGQQEAFSAICDSYEKILLVNLTLDSYQPIVVKKEERTDEKGFSEKLSEWIINFGAHGMVHPEDLAEYNKCGDLAFIREYFEKGNREYCVHYRRLIDGEYKQVMLEMVPSPKYAQENQLVFLYVKNIE